MSSGNVDVHRIAHDPAALAEFYADHIERVQRFIARRIDDPFLAADLTAEVFLAAIGSAGSYRPALGSPTGWLYGVAHNVVAAEHRRSARELRAQGRIAGRRLLAGDDLARIEERIDAEAQSRHLYLAMDRLSANERSVLELTALDGLSVTEAAQVLGIRAVTARVRLHRAREAMRSELAGTAAPLVTSTTTEAST
jgi:RNA polymerase sigma-70 factor (ECF subfamily)